MSTGLTTRYSLPFPHGDDPVANGDDIIQQLAERVEELAYERYLSDQRMYLQGLQFPQQMIPANLEYYPTGPFVKDNPAYLTYSSIVDDFPLVDLSNGYIYIPETGFYEVEVLHHFHPDAVGVSTTAQRWTAGWRDNTGRGRDYSIRGHLGSEVSGYVDAGGSVIVPFNTGQTVRNMVYIVNGSMSVSGSVRLVGPIGRPSKF